MDRTETASAAAREGGAKTGVWAASAGHGRIPLTEHIRTALLRTRTDVIFPSKGYEGVEPERATINTIIEPELGVSQRANSLCAPLHCTVTNGRFSRLSAQTSE